MQERVRKNIINRIMRSSLISVACVAKLFVHAKNELIVAHSTPPLLNISIIIARQFLQKSSRNSYCLIMLDLYPEIAEVYFSKLNKMSLFSKLSRPIYRFIYGRYDSIIVCANGMKDVLTNQYQVSESRISTIYNWALTESEVDQKSYTKKEIKIIGLGNFGALQLPRESCDIFKFISSRFPSLQIDLYIFGVSSGEMKKNLEKENNIKLYEIISRNELSNLYRKESLITFVSLNSDASNLAMPSRIATSLEHGAPILHMRNGKSDDIMKYIEENEIGVSFNIHDEKKQIKDKVQTLMARYAYYSSKARDAYANDFSKEKNVKEYKRVLLSLIK